MIRNLLIGGFIFAFMACASGHHEPFKETLTPVRDISVAQKSIQEIVTTSTNLTLEEIGTVEYGGFQAPIWRVSFRIEAPISCKILINAGIHGNEPASVACVMQLLEHLAKHPHQLGSVAIDLIPIVNPWGWVHDIRFNRDGIDINRDFSSFDSQEALIIKDFIEKRQYDLMLDLHEDPGASGFYVYQYGIDNMSSAENLIETIRDRGYTRFLTIDSKEK
jgi:predicted deacylase